MSQKTYVMRKDGPDYELYEGKTWRGRIYNARRYHDGGPRYAGSLHVYGSIYRNARSLSIGETGASPKAVFNKLVATALTIKDAGL